MAKIQIKSEELTPFGGIFSIMEQFDSKLSSVIPQIRNYAHHIMNWWSKSTSYPSPSFSCPVDNRQLRSSVFSMSAVLKS